MRTEIKRTVTSTSFLPNMPELRHAHCGSFVVNAFVESELLSFRLKTMSVNYTKCNILIHNYFSVELYDTFILFTQYCISRLIFLGINFVLKSRRA
jgi:type IV secretory pathway TrbL component